MIEVKNVKHSQFASEETMCFQCSVYWDGKKAGFAKNSGTGGETYIYWDDREVEKTATEWAEKQPKIVTDIKESDGSMFSYPYSLESAIDVLVAEFLEKRELRRWLRKYLVLHDPELPSGDFYHWPFKKYPQMNLGELKAAILRGRTKNGKKGGVFLNSLPFDEAFKIWGAA
tara:strand:+ start:656 stop:1171 length:516 start_codon:yes stop_codon:yes gene_type:complete